MSTARSVVNPNRRPQRVDPLPGFDATDFHKQLPDYAATPLHSLELFAGELGLSSVQLKDESDRFGLPAFKILGASWALERTLRLRPDVRVVVAASAGNHGRAVARAAAQRGLSARIYLPVATSPSRAKPIATEGAEVILVNGDYDDAVKAAQRAAREPNSALIADTSTGKRTDSAEWVIEGYATLFREAASQASAPFDLIVVPIGVGSFAAAAIRFAAGEHDGAHVIGVEPAPAACVTSSLASGVPKTIAISESGEEIVTDMVGLECATPSSVAWPFLRDGLTGTVTVTDDETHEAMRELAALGLVIGDCGAAPLAALRALATDELCGPLRDACELDHKTRVLCIGTEGATDPEAYQRVVGGMK